MNRIVEGQKQETLSVSYILSILFILSILQ
jgi:hypothetical protein